MKTPDALGPESQPPSDFDDVIALLDRAGEEERLELLREGTRLVDEMELASTRHAHGRLRTFAAAAAILMTFGIALWALQSGEPDLDPIPGRYLSGDSSESLRPAGDVDGFAVFEWSKSDTPGCSYALRIWLSADGPDAKPRIAELLDQNQWVPPSGSLDALGPLPRDIRWEVSEVDIYGEESPPRRQFARSSR